MFKIKLLPVATLLLFSVTSCKDYLEEELVGTLTYDYYNTEQGLEDLVEGSYEGVRFKYQYEQAYCLYNFGVDEFTNADQINFNYWNTYDSRLNALPPDAYLADLWGTYYNNINRCNLGISRLADFEGGIQLATEAQKNQRIGELRFLRGFYYFGLVQQFGAVPLTLEPSEGVELEFPRTPVPDVYRAIINDLRFASEHLSVNEPDGQFGRATKGAADHFLAKVYLTRGSAVTQDRGQQATDMDSAAYYADQVINSGKYALLPDYGTLWDLSSYSANVAAQTSSEIIFSAQWNNDPLFSGRFGNQTHLYFIMAYDQLPGMNRDIENGRPFRRAMMTDYAMDIYDRKNDSRFYKSLITTYYANDGGDESIPKWTALTAPDPSLIGQPKFAQGDTAVRIIVNDEATDLTAADLAKMPYSVFARYYRDSTGTLVSDFSPTGTLAQRKFFPTLKKYVDPFRATISQQQGTKDGILARFAETYLIAAEAYGRMGNYAQAVEYVNVLRQRAAYKEGEQKPPQFYLEEGGDLSELTSSTEDALLVTEDKFMTDDPAELYPPNVTSTQDRFIHFMLNERTREMLGELHRWEDLARTETLLVRAPYFNPDASGIQEKHRLRPIPQQHIERLFQDGNPLTAEERAAYQNPGY
ncbi:Starch-binding associating with outer membrane [Catalinimonas alkaloidigena]|uniref:Starch-binding associating with outer membrane n=1 Tax=Catalinimonas alkaloidigena TaxID=1075417 RepID=A0A1G9SVS3_9BACT|nr:RagB/SusD family nutrient uptake outer membrane protein [Catalinimonas alkaloidigena]SDM39546.1 Starch-binding associating with outer membrane [Catalinimonas alkaloidigena]